MQTVKSDLCFEEDDSSSKSDIHEQNSTKQSIKSHLQSIFHQYDDIQELFFQGDISSFDINACDSNGKTLLHHACEYGLTEGVSILLVNNAQADKCDEKGYSPLHYACQNNHIHYDICKILIQRDLSLLLQCSRVSTIISARCKHYNRTILHYACIHGDVDVAGSLLKAGADPCVKDIHGNSPMHYACRYDHLKSVSYFIAITKNPVELLHVSNNAGWTPFSMKTSSGGTILHIACDQGDIVAVNILLKAGADPNVRDAFGFTPLMRAVVSTSKSGITTDVVYSVITTLCNSKCNINASFVPLIPSDSNVLYYEGSTALHMAIDEWAVDRLCVQALVDNGAALDARDVHGRTPLHIASMWGHHRLIKILAPSPESFHFKDNDGCTPLYYACKNSHVRCIRKFFVHIPDVISDSMKVANNDGTTPLSVRTGSGGTILHVACEMGDINLVKKLLEAGADPNVTDEFGFTPLMRAVVSTSKSGITTDVVSSIITALCNTKCSVNASFVPSKPFDSKVYYYEGSTALHMAIDEWTDNQLCVQALVDNGAALDARDVHGRTPLHIASIRGHHPLIKLLAPSAESFFFKDIDGCTPLDYAYKNSHLEFIRTFTVQIPDIIGDLMKIANNDGTTPLSVRTGSGGTILHVACDKGDINLVKKLLEAGADPNVTDEFGFTPLMRAVVRTSKSGITTDVVYSIITALCNGKCNVNASFDFNASYCKGSTALHMAIDNWIYSPLCVQALVYKGAALDARDVHGRTPLHIASMRGHHHLIKLLASSPESFHFKDNDGCTPLYYACRNSHLQCIGEFMVQAPNVIKFCDSMKVANNDGTTPLSVRTGSGGTILHAACEKGEIDLVKKLLEAGADPNVTDEFGFTPLMRAVVRTSKSGITTDVVYSIITALCNGKCNVNASFDFNASYCKGSTALHMAIDNWIYSPICVQALVYKGAALDARDVHGRTPLHIASIRGHHPLIKLLAPSPESFCFKDNDGCTPLDYAYKNSHLEFIRTFTVQIPDIMGDLMKIANNDGTTPLSVRTGSGGTILHVACDKGDINLVKKLLEAGADPNVTDEFGFTPLMRAAVSTSKSGVTTTVVFSIITALCNSKCSVNASFVPSKPSDSNVRYCEGSTALHMAIDEWTDQLCVQALVDNGAALDARDVHGRTPLHIASIRGHHHSIKLLAPSPEFFYFKDNDGCTPLHYACKNSHLECIRELIVKCPDVISDLMKVANNDGNTPFSVRTGSGGTILHVACEKGNINLVKKLLEAGADPNVTDEFGFTPLMRAVVSTGITTGAVLSIITALCNSQCSVNASLVPSKPSDSNVQYCEGSTALHMAIDEWRDNQLCVQALVDNGAALDARDVHGRTPLHIASIRGHHHLIKLLAPSPESFHFKDNDGCTPLYYACENSHLECIRKFVVQTPDPDVISDLMKAANNDGTTPLSVTAGSGGTILHVACEKGDINLVKKLLEAGADPNVTDEFGFTPLMRAVLNTSVSDTDMSSIVTILCNSSCNVNATFLPCKSLGNYFQWKNTTALYMAVDRVERCSLGVQTLIHNGANVYVTDTRGRTPLHIASMRGHQSFIKLFSPTPESFHLMDIYGCTPLHYACKNAHLECVREFIVQIPDVICDLMKVANKYGATPLSVRTDNDQTILHVACEYGDLSTVKKILEAGADPNSLDGRTFTPLMLAVQYVDDVEAADIIDILCEFKCNLDIQTSHSSRSALHLTCELGKKKCVDMLVAKGASLLVRTEYGLTPLHLACKGGYHTLITFTSALITEETLKACDHVRGWTPLHYACYHHFECARMIVVGFSKLLLQTHTKYNLTFHCLRDEDGRTILHHACLRNDIQFVENLLNLGADLNVQDNNGATPLMSGLQCHGSDTDMDLLPLLLSRDWKPDIKDNSGRTALHYSAKCDDILVPLMLISAGCDVTAVDNYGQTFSDLVSKESLKLINKQLLRIDRRQIICVVGYPKCGKTTIIAAFQQAQQNHGTFQRLAARFQNTRVTLDDSRTSGIDTKVITTKRLGSLIFFDFAGQSEYYVSHLAFLESALSAKGSTITFIMMVDLRCSEEDRIAQCKEWLFPIKSFLKDHNMLNVILIGSHLDQVGSVSTSTSSLGDTLKELKRTLGTSQMQFIDCWGMDCRQLSSKGMTNLQNYLQSTRPVHSTSAETNQVPLIACLLFDRLKKSENPPLAITPSKIIDKLKDGHPPFPLTVKYIDSCCQDLAASGLVLYIPNREDAGESWLILEMEEILSRIHGKLFAPDSAEFPMHHKNLANQFGLVHVEELTLAFKDSPLDPELVRKFLMAMEFCHPVDSSLMTEGILDVLFSKVSANVDFDKRQSCSISTPTEKLLISNLCHNLLFFPSLVKANEKSVILSTESDIPGDDCHWVCWELSTVKPHFLHPRFQQAVFIRLACNHVQKHKSDLSTVEEHSCTVSKNAMSWSTIHGADVCIQIMHKSTIKVLARSRPGVKVSSLMEMFSSVVSDVLTVRANHAPGVDAYSVFRVMEKGTAGEHTVPVSSIIDVVQAGGMYVNSRERPPKLVSLKDLFLDWEISVTLLEKMVSISKMNHNPQATTEDVSEDTHSGPVMIDEHYYESKLIIYFNINSLELFQFSFSK